VETRAQETRTDRRAAKTNILQHSACWSLIQLPRLLDPGLHRTDASKCVSVLGRSGRYVHGQAHFQTFYSEF